MCGIFGVISKEGSELDFEYTNKIISDLFILSESRGKESSGIAIKSSDSSVAVLKKDIPAKKFIKSQEYKQFFKKNLKETFKSNTNEAFSIIAHSRLVTNGSQKNNDNNQPCSKKGITLVHNGIITNVAQLWSEYSNLKRKYEVDTEIIPELISLSQKSGDTINAVEQTFQQIEGAASIAVQFDESNERILATNTGSLYYILGKDLLVFASEEYILDSLISKLELRSRYNTGNTVWLEPNSGLIVNNGFNIETFTWTPKGQEKKSIADKRIDRQQADFDKLLLRTTDPNIKLLEFNSKAIDALKRCSKCILPDTFPYIEFDASGVCNYCNNYKPVFIKDRKQELLKAIEPYRKTGGKPDCVIAFSGGRDSSYGLHYIKEELGLNPITFTYDWGMVTDLARRNIARMCGKLGIENILVSADIEKKRRNIHLNVSAWLKRPELGMIPLFMAGDKHFFVHVNNIRRQTGIDLDIWMENKLENTDFKSGFSGIPPAFGKERIDQLSLKSKFHMPLYYLKNFIKTPSYINRSIPDTASAFHAYYLEPRDVYMLLFDYIPWDEHQINKTLIETYNWETSPDTVSTWRIGDGTAAFYNYIYYTVAGFSEFDTFRSNQVREGMITREEALALSKQENLPRFDSMKEYLEVIDIDFKYAVERVNKIQKLYSL